MQALIIINGLFNTICTHVLKDDWFNANTVSVQFLRRNMKRFKLLKKVRLQHSEKGASKN